MRKTEGCVYLSVLVLSLAIPALVLGAPGDDGPPPWTSRPCTMVVDPVLKPFAELAWEHSATFREQCRAIGAGRATVIVRSASTRETLRATARIGMADGGTVVALIHIKPGSNVLEFLAHELEHVVERVEGVSLLMESQRGESGVVLRGGAYETDRAIAAGVRVASEVDQARRTMAKAR